jgi:hypothetical protein
MDDRSDPNYCRASSGQALQVRQLLLLLGAWDWDSTACSDQSLPAYLCVVMICFWCRGIDPQKVLLLLYPLAHNAAGLLLLLLL